MHSAPTTLGPCFTGTTHANQQPPDSSSAWVANHEGNQSVPAGQQPLVVASYCLAGSSPNNFEPYNSDFNFIPPTARFQASELYFLGQIPEENLANDNVGVGSNVVDGGSTPEASFKDES